MISERGPLQTDDNAASKIACFNTVGEKQYGMKTEQYSNSQYP